MQLRCRETAICVAIKTQASESARYQCHTDMPVGREGEKRLLARESSRYRPKARQAYRERAAAPAEALTQLGKKREKRKKIPSSMSSCAGAQQQAEKEEELCSAAE